MLELKNASKVYGRGEGAFQALSGIDLLVQAGEFVAVVGRSGSGKSTLANLVTGIDRATGGTVSVSGSSLAPMSEAELAAWRARGVGIVFQSFQLLPTLTVSENVALPMEFAGVEARERSRRALELLGRMGVADQAGKLPTTLSGGQQQRVAIARALANDPPLIVADEPTGNLDSSTSRMVLDELSRLALAGKTVFLVTHERDVSGTVDRVVALQDGRIVSDTAGGSGFRRPGEGR